MRRAIVACLAAVVGGCGDTHFVEPNPPQLESLEREIVPHAVDEPLVFGLILDLYAANATDCARARSWVVDRISSVMLPAGREGAALDVVDLAPDCRSNRYRQVDGAKLQRAVLAISGRYPFPVRPVFVYVNNLDLEVPGPLATSLEGLKHLQNEPFLWALAPSGARKNVPFDRAVEWTYVGDEDLVKDFARVADAELPMVSRLPRRLDALDVFSSKEATQYRAFKVCLPAPTLESVGFPLDGSAVTVDPKAPPQVRVTLPDVQNLPRSSFRATPVHFRIEACRRNCDRWYEPAGEFWNEVPGCVLDR